MKNLKALYKSTADVLTSLSKLPVMRDFVLVGGSGLALYLNHRLSEDLDFFTNKKFSKDNIFQNLTNEYNYKTVNITNNQIDLLINNIKVTFCYQDNELLNRKEKLINNISIAQLDAIISMKIVTIFLRAKYRDYYDLYYYAEKFGVEKLFELGRINISGFSDKILEKSLVYIDDITDESINYLEPKKRLSINEIQNFFIDKIKETHHLK
jgi:predicted nucleotidyltransferase component of viral defense system